MGRTSAETERLQLQARILAPHSAYLFRLAGITSGMRVLDVGCGAGDVSMLLAESVGPNGAVIGVDMNPTILESARARHRRRPDQRVVPRGGPDRPEAGRAGRRGGRQADPAPPREAGRDHTRSVPAPPAPVAWCPSRSAISPAPAPAPAPCRRPRWSPGVWAG
ncbi:methyltransferase domain-containing protein [Streptomyces iranensis]